jgi:uncharacterized protein (DUF433 family)
MGPDSLAGAAYTADRAAALAGVPKSTLHYWAREGIWLPSVSASKVKRWSYSDLLALRLIDWLRKDDPDLPEVPRSSMRQIRRALSVVEDIGKRVLEKSLGVWIDDRGGIVLGLEDGIFVPLGDGALQGLAHGASLDLFDVYSIHDRLVGPHLVEPRPTLRIVSGKLSGEPHIAETRVPTRMLWTLHRQRYEQENIIELYPGLSQQNVSEAIDLEDQLERNLRHGRAA